MTTEQRRDALAEVTAARAALVDHLNQLEEQINVPKRTARAVGRGWRNAKQYASKNPAATAAIGAAGVALLAGAVTLIAKLSRR